MQRFLKYLLVFGLIMTVAACTTAAKKEEGEEAASAADAEGKMLDQLSDPSSPLATRVIYFDFDSSVIKAEFKKVKAPIGELAIKAVKPALNLKGNVTRKMAENTMRLDGRKEVSADQLFGTYTAKYQ